jgi:hypothetical protein
VPATRTSMHTHLLPACCIGGCGTCLLLLAACRLCCLSSSAVGLLLLLLLLLLGLGRCLSTSTSLLLCRTRAQPAVNNCLGADAHRAQPRASAHNRRTCCFRRAASAACARAVSSCLRRAASAACARARSASSWRRRCASAAAARVSSCEHSSTQASGLALGPDLYACSIRGHLMRDTQLRARCAPASCVQPLQPQHAHGWLPPGGAGAPLQQQHAPPPAGACAPLQPRAPRPPSAGLTP